MKEKSIEKLKTVRFDSEQKEVLRDLLVNLILWFEVEERKCRKMKERIKAFLDYFCSMEE